MVVPITFEAKCLFCSSPFIFPSCLFEDRYIFVGSAERDLRNVFNDECAEDSRYALLVLSMCVDGGERVAIISTACAGARFCGGA